MTASPDDLEHDVYQVAVIVQDNGQPSHSAITAVTVNFPKILTPLVGAQMAESDDILPMVLGAVAAVLLIILIILIVYICKRYVVFCICFVVVVFVRDTIFYRRANDNRQ